MASSFDVVKKVVRFKLQLTDTAESATVVKILQKLKDLDITLDILSETGIGKTVNSLRRHGQAGELAKSLVRGWKRLVPKESTSFTEDGICKSLYVKDELDGQNCPNNASLTMEDSNKNSLTSHSTSQNSSDEALFKTRSRKADSEKQCEEQKRHKDQKKNQESQDLSQNGVLKKNIKIQKDQMDNSVSKKRKNDKSSIKPGDTDAFLGNKNSEDTHQKSSSEKKSNKKQKESSKQGKESFSFKSCEKKSNTLKMASVKDDRSLEIPRSSEAQNKKRKKTSKEKHDTLKCKQESEKKEQSKNKKAKIKHKDEKSACEESSLSFESYLNYDVNVFKTKDKSGVKKPPKTKTVVKATKDPETKQYSSRVMSLNVTSPTQKFKDSVLELLPITIPLPDVLRECQKPFSVDYFERKDEKESDFCDFSEESAGFTGYRFNKKMQVYSGAKTVFLPAMMSLHQQCVRTLQNNINLLYETGGVPFEILEPVLERCTPEQLLHIEECNPIYIGETDHLWGKHCQRDFKDAKLQEYESWKEMYVRLSEERERKLKRLTKSIVSAHSVKPKGRQVKMAFIHTVAKPPRDVRLQQEIHGTAAQQPQLSVKVQDNRPRPSCIEPSRSSSSSGSSNTQDPRKKTIIFFKGVAPMMAKSLKAFKKQLGRR
ncbi:elongin A, like isoform X2 [Cottoperca gobio]|uniref:Elongin A, like isoform X2 n=1 Tax=Cottoperca gobio TaxID=56716 RepID=A0A6J2R487_COTGO|nr:elongin-A-like isoform X2 [Cottoperca gobio]